jgi:ABC-type transport system involved in multi-copper enzyme maturation permease subunit
VSRLTPVWVIAGYALQESLRRRVFLIVLLLTAGFLGLYGLGVWRAFQDTRNFVGEGQGGLDPDVLAGATVLGLGMFATLFLGVVLAVFLTLGAVTGDAERGLLQPLVVRPVGRSTFLVARFLGAAAVCAAYVALVFGGTVVLTGILGGWWPDAIVTPLLELAGAVVLVVALSLLGSVFLGATANGIAVFMLFGAGLVAGLLGQIGRAIHSDTLKDIGTYASWALPFEALYQDALHALTAATAGFTRFALELGPFGGAQIGGTSLRLWSIGYLVIVGAVALAAFNRKDL